MNDHDFGVASQAWVIWMRYQFPKHRSQGLLLVHGDVLVAKEDDLMSDEGVVDLGEDTLVEWAAKVYPVDLGPYNRSKWPDGRVANRRHRWEDLTLAFRQSV